MRTTIQEISKKIIDRNDISVMSSELKNNGKSIVFTNGCFDILHFGHIYLLSEAALTGDHLLVALNSDRSVREIKGEGRPLVNQADRAILLASLEMVDAVVIFDEATPEQIIREIKPDVLVKGGDYQESQVVGAEYITSLGGIVKIISLQENYSTTAILKKMSGDS